MISSKSTYEIVVLKGVFSGSGSLAIALPSRLLYLVKVTLLN